MMNGSQSNNTDVLPDNYTTYLWATTESSSALDFDTKLEIALKAIALLVAVIGLVLTISLLVILAIRFRGKWKKQLVLLMNILMCDVVICIAAIAMYTSFIVKLHLFTAQQSGPDPPTPEEMATVRRWGCTQEVGRRLYDVGTNANLLGLLLLTLDHLIAVHWSLKHATVMTNRWIIISCSLSWVLAIVIGFLTDMLIASTYHPDNDLWTEKGTTHYCYQRIIYWWPSWDMKGYYDDLKQQTHVTITNVVDCVLIAIVFIIMVIVYAYIARVVISVNNRRKASNRNYRKSKQNFKGIGTTLLLIGAFLLLNMPRMILYIMQSVNKTLEVGGTWGNVFGILAASTGIVDVCIYAGRNADVQGVFKSQKSRSISTYQPGQSNQSSDMANSSRPGRISVDTSVSEVGPSQQYVRTISGKTGY